MRIAQLWLVNGCTSIIKQHAFRFHDRAADKNASSYVVYLFSRFEQNMCIVCYSAIMAGVMYRYCNAVPPRCFVLAAIREIECANTLKHSILHLAIISCLGWKFVDAFSLHAKQECTHLEKMQRTMFSLDNLH